MEEGDGFLRFVESGRRTLAESMWDGENGGGEDLVGWSWVCERVLDCCRAYPSGVTDAILLSDLFQAWLEKESMERRRMRKSRGDVESRHFVMERRRKQQRPRLAKTVSIDSILEKKFISLDAVLEAVIIDLQLLPGTSSYVLKLGDPWSSSSVDLYLHRRFYDLIDADTGVLRPQREIRLTGCRLRIAPDSASINPRLLPTEYMSILLFEEHDDDAMLLGAQFFSDTFSSISPSPAQTRSDYSFYARLENIGKVETADQSKYVKLVLRDSNEDLILFLLWDEQVLLVNLLSEGSMVALERPTISMDADTGVRTHCGFCLEHGSGTRIYTVPYVPNKEQVTFGGNQMDPLQAAPLLGDSNRKPLRVSQVALPMDSQGSLNYTNFPSRLFIENLQPKMSHVTLYGRVSSIIADETSSSTFLLGLADKSGVTLVRLLFSSHWSGGHMWTGHLIFISGVATTLGDTATGGRVDCTLDMSDPGSKLVNVTQLPALLSSPCLHDLSPVYKLGAANTMQVSKIRVIKMSLNRIRIVLSHTKCGRSVRQGSGTWNCSFCCTDCDSKEVAQLFCAAITFSDASIFGNPEERQALCQGQAAAEILQTSPEDFNSWPLEEQTLFLYHVENKEYLATLYTDTDSDNAFGTRSRIARALKCD